MTPAEIRTLSLILLFILGVCLPVSAEEDPFPKVGGFYQVAYPEENAKWAAGGSLTNAVTVIKKGMHQWCLVEYNQRVVNSEGNSEVKTFQMWLNFATLVAAREIKGKKPDGN